MQLYRCGDFDNHSGNPEFPISAVKFPKFRGKLHWADCLVAEVRADLYRRLDSPELIDLGNWQLHLRRSIAEYLSFDPPEAGNATAVKDQAS